MDQGEVLVEVAGAVENAVAACCSMVDAVVNSKRVVVGEGVAVEAGSTGIAAVDSKAAAGSEIAAGSRNAPTRRG